MTLILALVAIFALVYAIALRARTAVFTRQLPAHECDEFGCFERIGDSRVYCWPDESDGIDVPLDGPPMVIIPMARVIEQLDFDMWEIVTALELGGQSDQTDLQ